VLNNQNLLLEALTNVTTNPKPREQSTNDKLIAFLRVKPPTFAGSNNPLDADDWLHVIKRKLEPFEHGDCDKVRLTAHQLTGTALVWWENYYAAAQDAQGVVLGEFLFSSILATTLFDSGASHSFVSSSFVEKYNIPTVLLKTPLLTRMPGGDIKCQLGCSRVRIILSGVEFLEDLVVLKSKGIDVILGMDC
jgi:hypothetical protein